jgi:threonine dehydratase
VQAMRSLGADVALVGEDFDAAREACEAAAAEAGGRYIHSMNEPLLIAGVATLYLEALEAVPDADVLIVPVGGGSGLAGAGLVARAVAPGLRVVGVQAAGAPAFYRSFRSGRPESTEHADTLAEGLATRQAFDLPLAMARAAVDDIVLVTDDEMADAMRSLLEGAHIVAEMAGAAPLAALRKLGSELQGKRVVMPVSGGNATLSQLAALFAQPAERR